MRTALLLALISAIAMPVRSEDRTGSEQEVREALAHFLRAFENRDMQSFIGCFEQDATVFFPTAKPPSRFDGRDAIQRHFEQVFAAIRQSSPSSTPPFHKLVPERLRVQLVGDKAAVVTFQMGNNQRVARRTLVLQKRGDAWLIFHLHAI